MNILSRFHRLEELANERWLGISTSEFHPLLDPDRPDFRGYAPTSYRDWRVMRRYLNPRGVFIDYGAGLGRVTILAARLPFNRVVGLDLDEDLVNRGNQNIRAAAGLRCPAEIICQDATTFDIPDDVSTLYFCNPFAGTVLAHVLEKVKRSRRDLQLICNLPHESAFEHEIGAVRWLKQQNNVPLSGKRKCLIYRPHHG